jgi:hypothetical protein
MQEEYKSSKVSGDISRVTPGFEEKEQRTPIAGYFLLLIMFIAALFFGWRAIDDLKDVPQKPPQISHCARPFISYGWEDYWRYGGYHDYYLPYESYEDPYDPFTPVAKKEQPPCQFSSVENSFNIPPVFEKRKATDREFQEFQRKLNTVSRDLGKAERDYGLGLQETVAGEERKLYPTPEIQQQIESLRAQKQEFEKSVAQARAKLIPLDEELKVLYGEMMKEYRKAWRWYEFKVFLLEAIFVFPFFFLVLWGYRRLLAKNSPYSIIFTALVGVASVLVLRILIVWLWSLFLARVIETIWEFIQNFALLKSILFYGGMVLSIAIFGGAVYMLQKRIFDPRRVAIRRLREKQCPHCRTSLDMAGEYCPNCGRILKEKCPQCGQIRWSDFPFCPHCKDRKLK